ncbi:hypothetical protein PSACC_03202 [Paramicrosporidium saccamoebae]|uniref:Uncharacterized protein n=1 Tax=Paramicrosporidium saccamoebae TaxID=1246581 RepID=A0A2H9TGQ5_9FUNG|nr:hypothetical protein PSACC_03202 [Paramicrosporidium saccamoebae]
MTPTESNFDWPRVVIFAMNMNYLCMAFLLAVGASGSKKLLSEPTGVNTSMLQIEHSGARTKMVSYCSGAHATLVTSGNRLTIEENGAFVMVIRDKTLFYPKSVFYVNDMPATEPAILGAGPGSFWNHIGMGMPSEEDDLARAIRLSLQDVAHGGQEDDDIAEALRRSLQDVNGEEREEKSEEREEESVGREEKSVGREEESEERESKNESLGPSDYSESHDENVKSPRRSAKCPRTVFFLSNDSESSASTKSCDGNINNGEKSSSISNGSEVSSIQSLDASGSSELVPSFEEVRSNSRSGAEKRSCSSSGESERPLKRRRIEPKAAALARPPPTETKSAEDDAVEHLSGRPMSVMEREGVNVPFRNSKGATVILEEGDLVVTVMNVSLGAQIKLASLLNILFTVDTAVNMTKLGTNSSGIVPVHITGQFFQSFLSIKELEEKTKGTHQPSEVVADQKFVIDPKVTFQGRPSGVRMSRPDSEDLLVALNGSHAIQASATMDKDGKSILLSMKGGACALLVRNGDIVNTETLPYTESQEPAVQPGHSCTEKIAVEDEDVVLLFVPIGGKVQTTLGAWAMSVGFSSDEMKEYSQKAYELLAPKSDVAVLITRISKAQQ